MTLLTSIKLALCVFIAMTKKNYRIKLHQVFKYLHFIYVRGSFLGIRTLTEKKRNSYRINLLSVCLPFFPRKAKDINFTPNIKVCERRCHKSSNDFEICFLYLFDFLNVIVRKTSGACLPHLFFFFKYIATYLLLSCYKVVSS